MSRRIRLVPHLEVHELEWRYRAAKESHERSWWQILWQLARGQTASQIAETTKTVAHGMRSAFEGPCQ